jgi:ribosomal protein L11 methyltransferase
VRAFRFRADLEQDPPAAAELWSLGCHGMQQDGEDALAWFDEVRPLPVAGSWDEEDDTDWLAAYYAGLSPVRLETLVIAPRHAPLTLEPGQRPLWLDPGTAFGTGHHETTRMALARLERLDLRGARVLDVGAGSGILAIAADLLGADAAMGVDVDERTLGVARANAAANRSRARFRVGSLDPDDPAQRCDVLACNLYAEALAELAGAIAAVLRPGGVALLTGILDEREERVAAALPPELVVSGRDADGPWRLLVVTRP